MKLLISSLSLFLLGSNAAPSDLTAEKCKSLSSQLRLENTTILKAELVPAGTNLSLPYEHSTCSIHSQIVGADVCRVFLNVSTGATSSTRMDAWLPLSWNGRFLGVGNGGMSGCTKYNDINFGARQGFATIGTNNGHDGTSGLPFYKNSGVVEDYVYRAIHTEAKIGKQISETFYGAQPNRSYYLGCSTGGRQGFKEAQEFPEDFDGIVAGAPAFDLNALMYWTGQFYLKTGQSGSVSFLSAAQWEVVFADVLQQCDGLDGVIDGVIEDPDLCQYRPEALICGAEQMDNCLTGRQAETVREVFSPVYGDNGEEIYPRLTPGAQSTERFFNGEPHSYPVDWIRYAIYNDSNWNASTLNPQDWTAMKKINPFNAATWEGDLSRAKAQGTKILHYHGLQDEAISSDNSARYYNHVSRTMGLPSAELDDFYRYFRISGMAHCRGGDGASFIGSSEETFAASSPDANLLTAIVKWVEEGVAPDHLLGTRFSDGTSSGNITAQRKHCKYPSRNVYKGSGDSGLATSWDCV